jgi:hypothetical protein
VPTKIAALHNKRVLDVACGRWHMCAVVAGEEGSVDNEALLLGDIDGGSEERQYSPFYADGTLRVCYFLIWTPHFVKVVQPSV